MKKEYIVPRPGLVVRDEYRRPIPENGLEVELTTYWRRRIADGDVVVQSKKGKGQKMSDAAETKPSKGKGKED
jgi:hypothetical protein